MYVCPGSSCFAYLGCETVDKEPLREWKVVALRFLSGTDRLFAFTISDSEMLGRGETRGRRGRIEPGLGNLSGWKVGARVGCTAEHQGNIHSYHDSWVYGGGCLGI